MLHRFARPASAIYFLMAFVAAAWPAPSAPAGDIPVRIRMATLAPKGSPPHQALLAMGEKWRQAPGGGAALTVYTDGSMGDEPDMVRRIRVGQLHAGTLTVQGLSEIDDAVTALQNIPMMFRSFDEI